MAVTRQVVVSVRQCAAVQHVVRGCGLSLHLLACALQLVCTHQLAPPPLVSCLNQQAMCCWSSSVALDATCVEEGSLLAVMCCAPTSVGMRAVLVPHALLRAPGRMSQRPLRAAFHSCIAGPFEINQSIGVTGRDAKAEGPQHPFPGNTAGIFLFFVDFQERHHTTLHNLHGWQHTFPTKRAHLQPVAPPAAAAAAAAAGSPTHVPCPSYTWHTSIQAAAGTPHPCTPSPPPPTQATPGSKQQSPERRTHGATAATPSLYRDKPPRHRATHAQGCLAGSPARRPARQQG
jgi:hypothetical protein